ncbi:MAG TPA: hypothetical protein VJQ43_00225 [Thermoplasmata archaeon]|nr:hypothetical protein [Thermoplasmata archaeon]
MPTVRPSLAGSKVRVAGATGVDDDGGAPAARPNSGRTAEPTARGACGGLASGPRDAALAEGAFRSPENVVEPGAEGASAGRASTKSRATIDPAKETSTIREESVRTATTVGRSG